MKILITGGLGHIGSGFLHSVRADDFDEIIILDNISTQRYASLFELPFEKRVRFIEEDIMTSDLSIIVAQADAVLHLAAITDAERSCDIPDKVRAVNFDGVRLIAESCLKNNKPLIFPSTTSVYGTQQNVVDESCGEAELKPQSPYAESKLEAEQMLAELKERGLRFVTFRLGTIVGKSAGMRFHTAVNRFTWQASIGRPITVWRTALDQKRPYLDLNDAVRAFKFALKKNMFDGNVYNLVTSNHTVREIVERIRRKIPELKVELVDSKIMNQLSYEVRADRIKEKGFCFEGNIFSRIDETLDMLRGLIPFQSGTD